MYRPRWPAANQSALAPSAFLFIGVFHRGEVQHALALVGKQGHEGFLRWPFTGLDPGFVLASGRVTFLAAALEFEPGLDLHGNSQRGMTLPRL